MKKLFGLILGTIVFNSLTVPVQAQSGNSCYMLDDNSKAIDLGYLCQKSNSASYSRPTINTPRENRVIKKPGVYIIPIKYRSFGVPVVDVKFNQKYTFEMLLDTGASGIAITQKMAQKLRVNYTGSQRVSTASNIIVVPTGHVYSVEVGGLTKKSAMVSTLPSSDIGLLGQSFFGNYDITIESDVVELRKR